MIADLLDMMKSQIRIRHKTGADRQDQPTYGAWTGPYWARVIQKPTKYLKGDGSEGVAAGVVWLGPLVADRMTLPPLLVLTDQIEMPGGATPPLLAIVQIPDDSNEVHQRALMAATAMSGM